MKISMKPAGAIILAASLSLAGSVTAFAEGGAHDHIGHVANSWKDTPTKAGLLPTAISEAKIALQHSAFAGGDKSDLKSMKAHTRHVLHAVDASSIDHGPGGGYGVKKAAEGVIAHLGFAKKSKGVSKNIKHHSIHIVTTSQNTIDRVDQIVALAKQVESSTDAAAAAVIVEKIHLLAHQLLEGGDANHDGVITWHKGEGGLNEANYHLKKLVRGEGRKHHGKKHGNKDHKKGGNGAGHDH